MLPNPPYIIDTPRFSLRQPREADFDDLYAIHSVELVNRYLPYVTWTSKADFDAWLLRAETRLANGQAIQLVMVDKANERVMGGCVLFGFDFDSGVGEIGYALGQPWWGQGVMRETMPALIRFAFAELGLRRLEAEADVRNDASHRLLLALGFTHEGMRRENRFMKGEVKSSNVYGLLKRDWSGAAESGQPHGAALA